MAITHETLKSDFEKMIEPLIMSGIKEMPDSWSKGIAYQQRFLTCINLFEQILETTEGNHFPENVLTKKLLSDYAKAMRKNPDLSADKFLEVIKGPKYSVSVAVYTESHQTTYHVVLKNNHQALLSEEEFSDENKIIPFHSINLEHANIEAAAYAKLLEVPFTPLEVTKNE